MFCEWREIPGHPNYAISEWGDVLNMKRDRLLKHAFLNGGMRKVSLPGRPNALVHILVWETYVGALSHGQKIEFNDDNRSNSHLGNLRIEGFRRPATACYRRGHPWTEDNTAWCEGRRVCRECWRGVQQWCRNHGKPTYELREPSSEHALAA